MDRKEIRISAPCTLDWRKMTPAEGGRFCGDCKKVVRNLSMMTEREARALMKSAGRELCVRFVYDEHGRVFFGGDAARPAPPPTLPASLLVRARRAAAVVALPLATASCDAVTNALAETASAESVDPPKHDELMGGMEYDPNESPPEPHSDPDAATDAGPDALAADAADAGPDGDPIN